MEQVQKHRQTDREAEEVIDLPDVTDRDVIGDSGEVLATIDQVIANDGTGADADAMILETIRATKVGKVTSGQSRGVGWTRQSAQSRAWTMGGRVD